jgi:hypothetical protein
LKNPITGSKNKIAGISMAGAGDLPAPPYLVFVLPGMSGFKKRLDLALDFFRYFYILTQLALFDVKRLCFRLGVYIPKIKNGIAPESETCIFLLQ